MILCYFFFNDTATTEIYTLSLHDALPIWPDRWVARQTTSCRECSSAARKGAVVLRDVRRPYWGFRADRKSTRLNSSHANISYAVFCLKKKKSKNTEHIALVHPI